MSHNEKSKNKRHRHKIIDPVDATVSAHFLEWRKPLAKLDPKLTPVRLYSIFKNDTQSGRSTIILSDLDTPLEYAVAPDQNELDTPEVSETGINADESSAPNEIENGEYEEDADHKTTKISTHKDNNELETGKENKFNVPPIKSILQDLLQEDQSNFFGKVSDLKRRNEEEPNKNEETSDARIKEDLQNAKIKGFQLTEDKAPMAVAVRSHQLTHEQKVQQRVIMDEKISKWLGKEKKIPVESSAKIVPSKNEAKHRESSHKVFFPFNVHREHKIVSFDDGHGMLVSTTNEPVYLHTPSLKELKDNKKEPKKIPSNSPVKAGNALANNRNRPEIRFDKKPIRLLHEVVQKEKVKPLPGNADLSLPASRPAIISRIDDRVPLELVYKNIYIFMQC